MSNGHFSWVKKDGRQAPLAQPSQLAQRCSFEDLLDYCGQYFEVLFEKEKIEEAWTFEDILEWVAMLRFSLDGTPVPRAFPPTMSVGNPFAQYSLELASLATDCKFYTAFVGAQPTFDCDPQQWQQPMRCETRCSARLACAKAQQVLCCISHSRGNIAIIAHVDHGKTTLVDCLMKQSGMGMKVTERMLDSKDLEAERGITILSKATRISWNGYLFNIVDTPGHADFGGEVERVLSMVDGVVLLVDAVEGPKAQTKFVLQKALKYKDMKPLVVVNKVDRPMHRDPGEVENDIFDIFATMATSDSQLDYPTLYASGKAGFCARTLEEARSENRPTHMLALFETIRDHVPPPRPVAVEQSILDADEKCQGFSMLVTQMDRLPGGLGPTVTGKVYSGQIFKGEKIMCKNIAGEVVGNGKVKEITVVQGVTREPVKRATAGDIVSVSVTGFVPKWTQTLVSHPKVPSIACEAIDPPVLAVRASVNDSPLAGKDGKYITMNSIGERLDKEAVTNPAIEIEVSGQRDYFEIRGRGEMQIGILIEEMRREGYEMTLSPPSVVKTRNEDGTIMEPWEDVTIEVNIEHGSSVIDRMSIRGATVKDMDTKGDRQTLKFDASTQAMLGMRSWLREVTGGTAAVVSEFKEQRPEGPKPPRARNGVLVCNTLGLATPVDLGKVARLGTLFIPSGIEVYPGMIFGQTNDFNDLDTNISRKHDGYESAKGIPPPQEKRLEEALAFIESDEKLEVTPKRIYMRKAILCANERRIVAKAAMKVG
ncbi:unnamed protein product [Polarella glacialis]|uniref:Tr-type G domain-containing protein n=1 Tax=Polarella glacialis TaxID=89957 RepID=A0A813FYK3_POLGL|nr:unnamed protein product [Polarella glacialis]